MARLSVPTTARLPASLRVDPSNVSVLKALNRLSRSSLLSLVLDWLDERNQSLCPPLLRRPRNLDPDASIQADEDDDDDDLYADDVYPPMRSLPDLVELYTDMQSRKGSRREVVDRIVEGDWRRGLSLYQLAMADQQYLYDHPSTLKWSCYKIQRLKTPAHEDDVSEDRNVGDRIDKETLNVPRFHPSTFLQNLQAEVLPDVKAHYSLDRPKGKPLLILRIFVLDSPYNTDLAVSARSQSNKGGSITASTTSFEAARTIYIAFPDASPHIYISKSQSSGATSLAETKSLRALVVEGVPKALSRPRERYTLKSTHVHTKNLDAMVALRGAGRGNSAQGGWSVYAADRNRDAARESPLSMVVPSSPAPENAGEEKGALKEISGNTGTAVDTAFNERKRTLHPLDKQEEKAHKRAKVLAQARFGDAAKIDDGKGIERLDVILEDAFPAADHDPGGVPLPVADAYVESESEHESSVLPKAKGKGRKSNADISLLSEEDEDDADGNQTSGEDRGRTGDRSDAQSNAWHPRVRIAFHGSHVFAGIRQLVEAGVVDGARMPGWMTGEEGVTVGAVRMGRIRGNRGTGL
ncbi:centromere protein Chl4/mis15/CENP-N [Xylariaceae sp. FL0016]|nr:centromere protein Chl4/mis15/CENP-N [Xylariaceae sp. FL0016]